jgi:hypothetical protein
VETARFELFLRRYLLDTFESRFVRSTIDSQAYDQISRFARSAACRRLARILLKERVVTVPHLQLTLRLKDLRETTGKTFWHIELMVAKKKHRKKRVCFVGHRFTPGISTQLRWNLRQVLEPYNIKLEWSGQDPTSVQIFEDIVKRIKAADFCVFDTRATKGKPNVYIEAGIAYAVGTPFILFDFLDGSPGASMPSDLAHTLSFRYSTYQALFREFYAALPVFAENNFH